MQAVDSYAGCEDLWDYSADGVAMERHGYYPEAQADRTAIHAVGS